MSRRGKTRFLKKMVVYSVFWGTVITAVYLWRGELTAGSMTAMFSFWGGELLASALLRLFGDGEKKDRGGGGEYGI